VIRHAAETPDVAGPDQAVRLDAFRTAGRDIRIVGVAYVRP
jgi:hypothetical protein